MSRAFVKEAEDTAADLPDRPISEHRNLVTPEGLRAIEAALGRFEAPQWPRSIQAMRTLPPRAWAGSKQAGSKKPVAFRRNIGYRR